MSENGKMIIVRGDPEIVVISSDEEDLVPVTRLARHESAETLP